MRLIPKTRGGRIRAAILLCALAGVVAWFAVIPWFRYSAYTPQEGDIVFQSLPPVELVRMIEGATASHFSHCGVVVNRGGRWVVCESIGSVHDTSLYLWVARGRGGRFCALRLRQPFRKHIPAFIGALAKYQGRPYDYQFQPDDRYLYCSELVYKAFRDASGIELGSLVRLGDLKWQPWEQAIRRRCGGELPLDRMMITPRDLAGAAPLEKVFSSGL